MTWGRRLIAKRRLIAFGTLTLTVYGVWAWLTMPRQEDPDLPNRYALILTTYPGADAETVERLVADPLEREFAEVEEIQYVDTSIRAGYAVNMVRLRNSIREFDLAWDHVAEALDEARREFPEEASEPLLDRHAIDLEAVVLAVTGSEDVLELAQAAERLERELLNLPEVSRILTYGDPGEQITIELDDSVARRLRIDTGYLAQQLSTRNVTIPSGSIRFGPRTVMLHPNVEFRSLNEIRNTPVILPTGLAIPLREVARVRRGVREPIIERVSWEGHTAVALGIVPREGSNIVEFGRVIREHVETLRADYTPLRIEEVTFQPDWVRSRLSSLGRTLLYGIATVAGVLVFFMGLRLGLIVAAIVPLVALSALGVFFATGGVLHQVSIGAFVVALGMLVDNAIVVTENVQSRLDQGQSRPEAVTASVGSLAFPLASATGTTLAMYIPIAFIEGNIGDFIRTLPIVVIITLTMSYLYAVLVTPTLASWLLRPRRAGGERRRRVSRWLCALPARVPWIVLALATALIALSLSYLGRVEQQFFPSSDHNQFLVNLLLPEGSNFQEIDAITSDFEQQLGNHPDICRITSFIGRAAPRFYYNLVPTPHVPHTAQLIVTTTSIDVVGQVQEWIRQFAEEEHPEIQVVTSRLEQGDYIPAQIEIRLFGADIETRRTAAELLQSALRDIEGTRDVHTNADIGAPTIEFEIIDLAAASYGVSRADVALALFGRTRGIELGQYRAEGDTVPIVIRSSEGEDTPPSLIPSTDITGLTGVPVPLAQVTDHWVRWRPAAYEHRNRRRVTIVLAQLADGMTYSQVLDQLEERGTFDQLAEGIQVEIGGASEAASEANWAVLAEMPLGLLLMLFFLMIEFNSFRRAGLILTTIPLAAIGVIPGLVIGGQPFGFPSLIGVVSLLGIVVNNAILLLDVAEKRRAQGATIPEALADAVRVRTRPILLTAATTIGGLIPLALSQTTLWPPLAWAMISGLLASTFLTLGVLPALYRLIFREPRRGGQAEASS